MKKIKLLITRNFEKFIYLSNIKKYIILKKNRYYLYRKTAVKCKKNIFFIKNKSFVFKGSRRQ